MEKSSPRCRDVTKKLKSIKIMKILQIGKIWYLVFKLGLYLVR